MHDPRGVLTNAENGTRGYSLITHPFYAITPERLAQLLDLERVCRAR
jgi:DNA replication protein DnaT